MKNLFILTTILLLASCSSSILDREYHENTYKGTFRGLFGDSNVSKADAVLINYAILRQGKELEGKTFGKIKEAAEYYKVNGLPEPVGFNTNSPSTKVKAVAENEGMGLIKRAENKKRMVKKLKFSCTYTNPTDKAVAIENTTFVLRGPIQDHIATVAYEVNCQVAAGGELTVFFVADSKNIRNNIMHNIYTAQDNIMFDEWADQITIQPSGIGVTKNARNFSNCKNDGARREPFFQLEFADLKDPRMAGKTHYEPELSDEPVRM